MTPSELDTLEQTASRTSIREALLLAYQIGRASGLVDSFISITAGPTLVERVDRVIGYDDDDAERLPLGWMPEVEDQRG